MSHEIAVWWPHWRLSHCDLHKRPLSDHELLLTGMHAPVPSITAIHRNNNNLSLSMVRAQVVAAADGPEAEQLGSYVMVQRADVLDAIGTFVAAYLAELPEAQNLQPAQLQAALKTAFKVGLPACLPACPLGPAAPCCGCALPAACVRRSLRRRMRMADARLLP